MNEKIKDILKLKEKDIDQINKVYALKVLEILKSELKPFNLKNQEIVIEHSMGGSYLIVNGKDFQRSKYSKRYRRRTWHKHPMFDSWKKLMEILDFLNDEKNSGWSFYLNNQILNKKSNKD